MNRRSLAALITLNAALLAALVVTLFSPAPVEGQQFGGGHSYLMIAGQTLLRQNQSMVYLVDLQSSAMVSLVYDANNSSIKFVAGRVISNDMNAAARGSR